MKAVAEIGQEGIKAIKCYCAVKDIREGKLKAFLKEKFEENDIL